MSKPHTISLDCYIPQNERAANGIEIIQYTSVIMKGNYTTNG